jgi:arylsulfatase A-like enzyme
LKAAGYHTAYLNSSYLSIWGERRFLGEAGLDVVEDAETLANRSRYRYQTWSIEGRALVDRFFEWRDALPAGEPFFATIWNVEGHYHYYWIGMPASLEAVTDEERYDRLLEYNDALLGRLYDGLAARGLAANTLLVAVGDHGQGLGRGERAYDRFESLLVSEDDIQIPLSFIDHELPRKVVTTPASLADVYPTVLDLLGMEVPAGLDGASLAREYQPRILISRAITWWPLAVRAGAFKLEQDFADEPPVLYDVSSDPWELRDVAGEHPDVTDALWAELARETARRQREDPSFSLFSFSDRRGR